MTLAALALVFGTARAACPDPAAAIEQAHRSVLRMEDELAREALTAAEAGFGCGAWATQEVLGRLWLVEGARAALAGDDAAAEDAFAAAGRVAPGLWNEDLGPDLYRRYEAAQARPAQPPGELRLTPPPTGLEVRLDGQPAQIPALATGGLHLLQVGPPDGPTVFALIFLMPPDELLTIETGLPEDLGPRLAAEAEARRAIERLDPKVEAEITEIRRRAARAWGQIEADTRGTDERAERQLRAYVARYGDASVRAAGQQLPVDLPQVREARARLDALPAARASQQQASASEQALNREMRAQLARARAAEEAGQGVGLRRVDLGLGLGWTRAGAAAEGGEATGGLGPSGSLGAAFGLAGAWGLRAELGYRSLLAGPESEAPEHGVSPSGTALHLGYGALAATFSRPGLDLQLGPVYALGGGRVPANAAFSDPEAMGLPELAPAKASVRAGGALAGLAWRPVYVGRLRAGPTLRLGALTDLERLWPFMEIGATVGWLPSSG